MKNKVLRKGAALLMSLIMIYTILPVSVLSYATTKAYPVMEYYTAASSEDYHQYYNKVVTVTFLDAIDYTQINSSDTISYWDVSAAKDLSVMAWMKLNNTATDTAGADRYDVYIAGDGGVAANENSKYIFYSFSELVNVNFNNAFHTDNATSFYAMFYNCYKIESVTGINWNTTNVTDMSYMFRNCHLLKELDLSSFNTSNVTTMKYMFYYCNELEYIYVGSGWSTASITNLNDGVFNCCYAIVGGKDIYDSQFAYVPPGASYAKLTEDGGFLTYKSEPTEPEKKEYKVTYEFTGSVVPEGVALTPDATYEEGTSVSVATVPSADGYRFSGWSTDDADISSGTFIINNDVHIVGSWEKLYTVTYKYDIDFDIPENAPELPCYEFAAGEAVTVDTVPFVEGYVFEGWYTSDVTVISSIFEMPEKEVVLYGYFKRPVESVEINGGDLTINFGEEPIINVTVSPDDATVKDIVYFSDNEEVVKIDENGKITTIGEGTAKITVSSKDDPTKYDEITVTVKIPVTNIELDKEDIVINKNDTNKINVTITPANASNKNIKFTSDNTSVVTVDENGNFTAVGEGEATITVRSEDNPSVVKTVKVTVKIPVTEITASADFTLNVGEERNVDASTNDDATNKELIYESSDPAVAKVDSSGNVVAVGEGSTTIIITSKDNPEIFETVTINIKIPVDNIIIPQDSLELEIGDTDSILTIITPDNATNKALIYSSSDESVATVDNNGNIAAVGEGTATIRATSTDNPSKYDEIIITVKKPVVPEETTTAPEETTTLPEETTTLPEETTTLPEETTTLPEETTTLPEETTTLPEETTTLPEETTTLPEETTTLPEETTTLLEETTTLPEETTTEPEDTTTPDTPAVPDEPSTPDDEDYVIEIPEELVILTGVPTSIIKVTPEDAKVNVTFSSSDENIAFIDENGKVVGILPGNATIYADFGNGDVRAIPVIVIAPVEVPQTFHICFGKTDGIGWYEVSVNGGDFKPQGPNSTLEVEKGSVIVVRVQDMWINDDFTFYVNGKKVEKDSANCITLTVDGYMLIGALSMDTDVPDIEESVSLLQKLINFIKALFNWIFNR